MTHTIEWLGPAARGNYMVGRSGNSVAMIVEHWVGSGTLDQAVGHFKNPASGVSAHYVVGTDGRIVQVVADEDTAYHAGNFDVNLIAISVEHEATPSLAPSEALYEASAWLHRHLADTHGLALEVGVTVKRHNEIVATQCPGTLDVERIVAMAQEYVTRAEFDAYVADARNTFEAIKAELAEQAHHSHDATTGEPKPPRELVGG